MATWGIDNRTTALRVIPGSPASTRVEYRFAAADMTYENISTVVTADLGYTVGIEHYQARLAGQDVTVPVVLRVTHIFRREDGGWKIVHRHADPIMSKQETASVIQR